VRKSEVFSTAEDNQTAVDIHVLQGERPMASDNKSLGRFRLEGIPPAPRGMPQVEVTFDIDANGILNVAARDKATGKEQKVTITASTNLSKQEIEAKIREARENEAVDRSRRELAEARNTADSLAHQTEKTLNDLRDKIAASERSNIEAKINELREAAKGEDISRIRTLSSELQNAFHAISQQLYAQQQGQPGQQTPEGNGSRSGDDEGEVVEGEFREA